ncbi:MAG: hypothetical protein Kow0069_07200 [Promethearchaeota archaeon]
MNVRTRRANTKLLLLVAALAAALGPLPAAPVGSGDGGGEFVAYLSLPAPGAGPVTVSLQSFVGSPDPLGKPAPRVANSPPPRASEAVPGDDFCLLLVEFSDVKAQTPASELEALTFGDSGSVRAYWSEASLGGLDVAGSLAGSGWWSVSNPMSEYGADAPDGGVDQENGHPNRLVADALQAADATVDFSTYDRNGDGVVDHLIVVHAGSGQEENPNDEDLLWSHYSGVRFTTNDGVEFVDYAMAAEDSPMGVVAHEVGHDLGLPDLYDVDYTSDGIGDWGLMGSGSWLGNPAGSSPAHPCAWSKAFLGFVVPVDLGTGAENVSLAAAETSSSAIRLSVGPEEYFLLENRRKVGFDSHLPGEGLLVWHVEESAVDNSDESRRLVDLEEADGNEELDAAGGPAGESTDVWGPGRDFTPDSTPNSNANDGSTTGWRVYDVSPPGEAVNFSASIFFQQDAAVEDVDVPTEVVPGEGVKVPVRVYLANRGTEALSGVQVVLKVREGCRLSENPLETFTASDLALQPATNWTWEVNCSVPRAGKWAFEARVSASGDQNPLNDLAFAHLAALAPVGGVSWDFEDDWEDEQAKWDRQYEHPNPLFDEIEGIDWSLVNASVNFTNPHSVSSAWHFGFHHWSWKGSLLPFSLRGYNASLVTSQPVDLSGLNQAYLAFYELHVLDDLSGVHAGGSSDGGIGQLLHQSRQNRAVVQASTDGATWTDLEEYFGVGSGWTRRFLNLSSFVGVEAWLRFRVELQVAVSIPWAGFCLDDLSVTSTPPEPCVAATPVQEILELSPGESTETAVKVVNLGDQPDAFEVSFAGGEGGASTSFEPSLFVLGIDDVAHAWFNVSLAADASPGTNITIVVLVRSSDSGATAAATIAVRVVRGNDASTGIRWFVEASFVAALAGVVVIVALRRKRVGPR